MEISYFCKKEKSSREERKLCCLRSRIYNFTIIECDSPSIIRLFSCKVLSIFIPCSYFFCSIFPIFYSFYQFSSTCIIFSICYYATFFPHSVFIKTGFIRTCYSARSFIHLYAWSSYCCDIWKKYHSFRCFIPNHFIESFLVIEFIICEISFIYSSETHLSSPVDSTIQVVCWIDIPWFHRLHEFELSLSSLIISRYRFIVSELFEVLGCSDFLCEVCIIIRCISSASRGIIQKLLRSFVDTISCIFFSFLHIENIKRGVNK